MSGVASRGTANHANNLRTALNQVMKEALNLGLVDENVAAKVKPHRVPKLQRTTLTPDEVRRLLGACDERFQAAVGLGYLQGWRISEALGVAWQDLDLDVTRQLDHHEGLTSDAATVLVRRGATTVDGHGMVLGPTKSPRAGGRHLLAPSVVALLQRRREIQDGDRKILGEAWQSMPYDGEVIDPVFTDRYGKLEYRKHVDRAIRAAADTVGLDRSALGTHNRRRSVVTNLYATGAFDLGDVASFVGHRQHDEGQRPARGEPP